MTYYIQPEEPGMSTTVIMRSGIKSRRNNIGKTNEYTMHEHQQSAERESDPHLDNMNEWDMNILRDTDRNNISGEHDTQRSPNTTNKNDPHESLPTECQPHTQVMDDQLQMEDDQEYGFERIIDYYFKEGILMFKVRYNGELADKTWDIPFNMLRRDAPYETAKYIKTQVAEIDRRGTFATCANNTIRIMHTRTRHLQNISSIPWSHYHSTKACHEQQTI